MQGLATHIIAACVSRNGHFFVRGKSVCIGGGFLESLAQDVDPHM